MSGSKIGTSVEIWKHVVEYKGSYEVSDHGRVRNAKNKHILSQHPHRKRNSYLRVSLSRKNRLKGYLVHQLVATAFIGPYPEGKEVDHIDRNPSNNHLSNLRYLTHLENTRRGERGIKNKLLFPGVDIENELSVFHIIEDVCSMLEVDTAMVLQKCRYPVVVQARHLSMVLCFYVFKMSKSDIGRVFLRDHSVVIHALKKIRCLYDTESSWRSVLNCFSQRYGFSYPPVIHISKMP